MKPFALRWYMYVRVNRSSSILSDAEATIVGVPTPVAKDWLDRHATRMINHEVQANLVRAGFLSGDFIRPKTQKEQQFAKVKYKGRRKKAAAKRDHTPVAKFHVAEQKAKAVKSGALQFCQTDAFLNSYEWATLRMKALKLHGAKCQCCGDTPANGAVMNVDHIKPRKYFPELALMLSNLQVACSLCNKGKGNWDQTDWRPSA